MSVNKFIKSAARFLSGACSLLLFCGWASAGEGVGWRFPLSELTSGNVAVSIGEGAEDVYVWACKPGMSGPTSASASTSRYVVPAGQYELRLRLKVADNKQSEAIFQVLAGEDGVGLLADIKLFTTDVAPAGKFVDCSLPLVKSRDRSSLYWSLKYLGRAVVEVDEVRIVPVFLSGDTWPEVEITRLGPAGLVNPQGRQVEVVAALKNYTVEPQSLVLTVRALTGVDKVLWNERRAIELAPMQSATVPFAHPALNRPAGVELVAELSRDGRVLHRRSEVFAVADNFNAVSQFGGVALDVDPKQAVAIAAQYRMAGIAAVEVDFWAPCDFSGMAPETDSWISGQGLRQVSKSGLQQAIRDMHSQGLRVLTYGDMWLSGPAGFEWARRRPQQAMWEHIWYGGEYDVGQLDALRAGDAQTARKIGGSWSALTPRLARPEVQRFVAGEIRASAAMFGWDGIRYDNSGLACFGGRDLLGHEQPTHPPDDSAAASAEMIATLRRTVTVSYPHFVFGDNIGGRNSRSSTDAKWRAEAADGGMIFEEAVGERSSTGTWAELARHAVLTAQTARACGGYQVNHVSSLIGQLTWSARPYAYVLELAAGAHVAYAAPGHAMRPYCLFAMRYGDLLYDLAARPLAGDNNPFQAAASLWWKDYATRHDLPKGEHYYVVSLVQPPPVGRVAEQFGPVKPLGNVPVQFRLPAGERVRGAWALEPDQPGAQKLELSGAATLELIVPRVHYWTVVVVETHDAD